MATFSFSDDCRQAVLSAFLRSSTLQETQPPIRLHPLDSAATYAVRCAPSAPGAPPRASSAYGMRHGLQVALNGDFQAAVFVLEAKA